MPGVSQAFDIPDVSPARGMQAVAGGLGKLAEGFEAVEQRKQAVQDAADMAAWNGFLTSEASMFKSEAAKAANPEQVQALLKKHSQNVSKYFNGISDSGLPNFRSPRSRQRAQNTRIEAWDPHVGQIAQAAVDSLNERDSNAKAALALKSILASAESAQAVEDATYGVYTGMGMTDSEARLRSVGHAYDWEKARAATGINALQSFVASAEMEMRQWAAGEIVGVSPEDLSQEAISRFRTSLQDKSLYPHLTDKDRSDLDSATLSMVHSTKRNAEVAFEEQRQKDRDVARGRVIDFFSKVGLEGHPYDPAEWSKVMASVEGALGSEETARFNDAFLKRGLQLSDEDSQSVMVGIWQDITSTTTEVPIEVRLEKGFARVQKLLSNPSLSPGTRKQAVDMLRDLVSTRTKTESLKQKDIFSYRDDLVELSNSFGSVWDPKSGADITKAVFGRTVAAFAKDMGYDPDSRTLTKKGRDKMVAALKGLNVDTMLWTEETFNARASAIYNEFILKAKLEAEKPQGIFLKSIKAAMDKEGFFDLPLEDQKAQLRNVWAQHINKRSLAKGQPATLDYFTTPKAAVLTVPFSGNFLNDVPYLDQIRRQSEEPLPVAERRTTAGERALLDQIERGGDWQRILGEQLKREGFNSK